MRSRRDQARFFGMPRDSFDWTLFLTASALAVIGVINLYSATSVARAALTEIHVQQVYWLVLGGILGAVVAVIDYRHYERLGYLLYGVGIIFLVLVFILGKDIRGSSRWIAIGSFGFQPSEFMKLFLIIALAKYLHDDPRTEARSLKDLIAPAVLTAVPTLLVLKQPDLGTALIHVFIFVTVCLLTKIRWQTIVGIVVSAGIALPLAWTYVLKDYQKQRVTVFLNPEANLLGSGWHAHHARVAIGAGGWKGQGFMQGTQNQFLFLPDQHSDFPFAVFAEDWGFSVASCSSRSTGSSSSGRFASRRRRRIASARCSRSAWARSSSGTRSSTSAWSPASSPSSASRFRSSPRAARACSRSCSASVS